VLAVAFDLRWDGASERAWSHPVRNQRWARFVLWHLAAGAGTVRALPELKE